MTIDPTRGFIHPLIGHFILIRVQLLSYERYCYSQMTQPPHYKMHLQVVGYIIQFVSDKKRRSKRERNQMCSQQEYQMPDQIERLQVVRAKVQGVTATNRVVNFI